MAGDTFFHWHRPATGVETLFDCANRKGHFVTIYALSLCSASPVGDDMMENALKHLFSFFLHFFLQEGALTEDVFQKSGRHTVGL
ncbi:hypothetical protein E2C01_082939 [Portunus trituberculatus]|uniref:Uncharacterized protein n=1 Tax=Portunus trituberculatus TaxID=210409 RepID=A0A5B7J0E8_PORTR|nr:hypothetical protein [Portunus trituberculatus]